MWEPMIMTQHFHGIKASIQRQEDLLQSISIFRPPGTVYLKKSDSDIKILCQLFQLLFGIERFSDLIVIQIAQ